MAKRRRRSSGSLRGSARAAKAAPATCKKALSTCMKGGGRKQAGRCMKAFNVCRAK